MQTNVLQDQIESLQILVEQLLDVLHPGVVGLIQANHGKDACAKACAVIAEAKTAIAND